MSTKAVQFLGCVALAIAGMAGLHLDIEYSGWVLFVGLFGVIAC